MSNIHPFNLLYKSSIIVNLIVRSALATLDTSRICQIILLSYLAADTSVIETGVKYHALLSRRFDRTDDGQRKHYVEENLRQLYRRVAFNIAIGNSDDHFRNHGFLLTPKGWTLSPAYDMNPTLNGYQALLINSTTNRADLQVLLDSSEEYMIGKEEAGRIIDEVKAGVKHWKSIATRLGIAKREMDVFGQVFQRSLK